MSGDILWLVVKLSLKFFMDYHFGLCFILIAVWSLIHFIYYSWCTIVKMETFIGLPQIMLCLIQVYFLEHMINHHSFFLIFVADFWRLTFKICLRFGGREQDRQCHTSGNIVMSWEMLRVQTQRSGELDSGVMMWSGLLLSSKRHKFTWKYWLTESLVVLPDILVVVIFDISSEKIRSLLFALIHDHGYFIGGCCEVRTDWSIHPWYQNILSIKRLISILKIYFYCT